MLFFARHVPEQMWYTHPAFAIALGGVLPFGAVCIELFFIMSALWLHQVRSPSFASLLFCHTSLDNEQHRPAVAFLAVYPAGMI